VKGSDLMEISVAAKTFKIERLLLQGFMNLVRSTLMKFDEQGTFG